MFDNAKYSKDAPLVSIIVITYNSSKYVIETLESAKNQTYKNIELIISDDCSTDGTVQVCKEWIIKNKQAFKRVELITVPENTGIPKNCNRGLYAAKGKWIKMIAGDDALFTTCVYDNIEFVKSNNNIQFCFSDFVSYNNTLTEANMIPMDPINRKRYQIFSKLNIDNQLEVITRGAMIHGGATFYRKDVLIRLGGYDETFPFMEDWSTWYRLLQKGIKFYYLPKKTIKYRLHAEAITKKVPADKSFSITAIKKGIVIRKLFLKHYTFKERLLFRLENAYYNYYQDKEVKNVISKSVRRLWYVFLIMSIKERKKSIKYLLQSADEI